MSAAAFAVLCVLRERQRTGGGQFIDFAQAENLCQQAGDYFVDHQWSGVDRVESGNRDL